RQDSRPSDLAMEVRRPLKTAALIASLAALVMLCAAPVASATDFWTPAKKGIRNTRLNWWNPHERWYNDRLNDLDPFPLATTWSIVPLWEATNAVAIGQPTKANKKAVRSFANIAEKYF